MNSVLKLLELRLPRVPPVLMHELTLRSAKMPSTPNSPEAKAVAELLLKMPTLPYRDPLEEFLGTGPAAKAARTRLDDTLDALQTGSSYRK